MATHRHYGTATRRMLAALRSRGLLDQEAFAQHLADATGEPMTKQQVSLWTTGEQHLPADVLPHLAAFVGRTDLVFDPLVRASGLEPAAPASEPHAIHAVTRSALDVAREIAESTDPESPGGAELTDEERDRLRRELEDAADTIERALVALRPNTFKRFVARR